MYSSCPALGDTCLFHTLFVVRPIHLCQVCKVFDTFGAIIGEHFHLIHTPMRLRRLDHSASQRMP